MGLEVVIKKVILTLAAMITSITSYASSDPESRNLENMMNDIPVGHWELQYDWECDDSYARSHVYLSSDKTFYSVEGGSRDEGIWKFNGKDYKHIYTHYDVEYTGVYDGVSKIVGTMRATGTGCFIMSFVGPTVSLEGSLAR
jgi:hypothetical protein